MCRIKQRRLWLAHVPEHIRRAICDHIGGDKDPRVEGGWNLATRDCSLCSMLQDLCPMILRPVTRDCKCKDPLHARLAGSNKGLLTQYNCKLLKADALRVRARSPLIVQDDSMQRAGCKTRAPRLLEAEVCAANDIGCALAWGDVEYKYASGFDSCLQHVETKPYYGLINMQQYFNYSTQLHSDT